MKDSELEKIVNRAVEALEGGERLDRDEFPKLSDKQWKLVWALAYKKRDGEDAKPYSKGGNGGSAGSARGSGALGDTIEQLMNRVSDLEARIGELERRVDGGEEAGSGDQIPF